MPSNFELLDLDKVDLNHVRPSVGSERSKKRRARWKSSSKSLNLFSNINDFVTKGSTHSCDKF